MECRLCQKPISENDDSITCDSCGSNYHEEELVNRFLFGENCPSCGADFDPYLIFELTDKYDLEASTTNDGNASSAHYYLLNGIFGLMPAKSAVKLIIILFVLVSGFSLIAVLS